MKDLNEWIQKGKDENYLSKNFILRTPPKYSNEYIRWFEELKDIELGQEINVFNKEEIKGWKGLMATFSYLLLYLLGLSAYSILKINQVEISLYSLSFFSGLLGSSIAVIYSVLDRYAQGFEDKNGFSHPIAAKGKSKYNHRMLPWFIVRPFFGAVIGIFMFYGIKSGYIPTENFDNYKVVFWSFIGGLLAKSIVGVLKDLVKNVFKIA